jgi:uncharacterized protein YhdP
MQGFPAPVTDLSGVVTVGRDDISSESLGGTFLGSPVSIDLRPAPDDMPEDRVVATANGTATAAALVDELGVPLAGSLDGATAFEARMLFARGELDAPKPFRIDLSSTLDGISVDHPQPCAKPADTQLPLTASIE